MSLSKIGITIITLEKAFYKNIATNDDYINNYCVPSQFDFTDKSVSWYLYNKTSDLRDYEKLWTKYCR